MKDENKEIALTRKDVDFLVREIEFISVSLSRLDQHFEAKGEKNYYEYGTYCAELTEFIDSERVTARLAKMRSVVSSKFDRSLDDDDKDDVERALEDLTMWERPGDL